MTDSKDHDNYDEDPIEFDPLGLISPELGYNPLSFSSTPPQFIDSKPEGFDLFPNFDEDKIQAYLKKIRDNLEASEQMEYDLMIDTDVKKQYLFGAGLEKQIKRTNELKMLSDTYETRLDQLESKIGESEEINETLRQQNKLLKQEISELKNTYQPILNILKKKLEEKEKLDEQVDSQKKEYGIYR